MLAIIYEALAPCAWGSTCLMLLRLASFCRLLCDIHDSLTGLTVPERSTASVQAGRRGRGGETSNKLLKGQETSRQCPQSCAPSVECCWAHRMQMKFTTSSMLSQPLHDPCDIPGKGCFRCEPLKGTQKGQSRKGTHQLGRQVQGLNVCNCSHNKKLF